MTTATSAAPSAVIEQPHLTPPKISLLTSAIVVDDVNLRGDWIRGLGYSPEGCGGANLGLVCPGVAYAKTGSANPAAVAADPFVIWTADKCSAFGFKARDFYGRARRRLLASESYYLEREFMTNTLGITTNQAVINDPQVTVTTITSSPLDPVTALAQIEDEIGNCLHGGRMMVHVRPGVLTLLVANQAIRREGNVWLTATDNIVVPGRGYPGSSPTGVAPTANAEWIYATSMVQIYRDEIQMLPKQAPITEANPFGLPPEAIDRSVNDVTVLAERMYAITWDPTCCVLAAQTTRTFN